VADALPRSGVRTERAGLAGDGATVEETRRQSDRVAGHGINDVVDHYAGIIGGSTRSRSSSVTPSAG
jgi:hypothetical protein